MRQVTMVTLLVGIFVLIMQCSKNESLNVFNGRMETVNLPIVKTYYIGPDTIPDTLLTDSIRWVYGFPSGGSSSVSIIISGQIKISQQTQAQLEVETYIDSVTRVPLALDSVGVFIDTVPIAASPLSGKILPQSSRLFVWSGGILFDSIPIVNPHAALGQ